MDTDFHGYMFFDTQGQRDGMAQQDIDGIKYGQCATCAKEFENILLER